MARLVTIEVVRAPPAYGYRPGAVWSYRLVSCGAVVFVSSHRWGSEDEVRTFLACWRPRPEEDE